MLETKSLARDPNAERLAYLGQYLHFLLKSKGLSDNNIVLCTWFLEDIKSLSKYVKEDTKEVTNLSTQK
jgi:hypothetical protein